MVVQRSDERQTERTRLTADLSAGTTDLVSGALLQQQQRAGEQTAAHSRLRHQATIAQLHFLLRKACACVSHGSSNVVKS